MKPFTIPFVGRLDSKSAAFGAVLLIAILVLPLSSNPVVNVIASIRTKIANTFGGRK